MMKRTILYKLLVLGFAAFYYCTGTLSAQDINRTVSGAVQDELGNPISDVYIYGAKGVSVSTDNNGSFEVRVPEQSVLIMEKDGFDSQILAISDVSNQIVMSKSLYLAASGDEVKMGINTKTRRALVGAASIINPADHLTYDNRQWVRDYIQGLLPGVRGSSDIRGLGGALFVIDGVIGRSPDMLNMDEVDQIAVLKDANTVALYGAQAKNGVIIINTKRGQINQKRARVNVRYGIKTPISWPSYLNAADYMEYYNEARVNDGLSQQYTPGLIENTRSGLNPYKYPDVDLYSDEYVRSAAQTVDAIADFSGGNEKTQYYVNMGWNYSQSWVKLNPEANSGQNRFNVRGNIDFKVNDFIKSSIDAVAVISSDKRSNTNLLLQGATLKPNAYAPLLPVSMMDTASNPSLAGQVRAAGIYDGMLLGGSQIYQNTVAPIADVIAGGYTNQMFRSAQFNNSIDFDLDMITEGLSAKTYLSFDFYDAYNISINNKFRVYEPTWSGDMITGLTPYGEVDQKDQTENVNSGQNLSRFGFYGLINYDKAINANHHINSTFLGYINSMGISGVLQNDNSSHLGLQVTYDYRKKLFFDFSGAYVHSIKLPEGNRGGFSPTGGLAYILSEEDFLRNNRIISFLKLKATAGLLKSDLGIDQYYLYAETYARGYQVSWNDGGQSNYIQNISQGANPRMSYEERLDINVGFEALLLKSLFVEFNYFKSDIDKQLTTLNTRYPSFYNPFKPYDNYNKDSYSGFETGLEYTKIIKDLSLSIGGNIMYVKTETVQRDEVFDYDYQYKEGQPVYSIYGLTDLGFYQETDFTTDGSGNYMLNENLPVPAYGSVQPGDIKYADKNEDGLINDNDKSHIGQWGNPWSYGLHLKLSYKGFSLFVLGLGQFGGEGSMSGDYYWIEGEKKYSNVVLNRWTPATANTASYPRLSSLTNNNNYQTSTFWMYGNSFFDIQRAQLSYEFNEAICKKLKMRQLSVNIAGYNLIRVAQNKDIQQLNVAGNPQFRHFTLGLRTTF